MSKLHIFIDGSWLFKACAADRALSNRMEYPDRTFKIDFTKLKDALLNYANSHDSSCNGFGDLIFCTSIFALPEDLDEWPTERDDISEEDITSVRRSVSIREGFANLALDADFSETTIFRPPLKGWMIEKLRNRRFQEKQVDATVVAMLVRSAITNIGDYHAIITGDADILPAIKVAYPEYSNNVFIATTHPDQLSSESRQTSFSLTDFDYAVPPYYLEQHAINLIQGENTYSCSHCGKIFTRPKAIPRTANPCCHPCHQKRT